MDTAMLNIAHWIPRSSVNGPGERFVVWVQGCPLACPGCWNPDTWSSAPKILTSPGDFANEVVATSGIEGLTISGGEPFLQAGALADVAKRVRAAGLSVMIFTGFELDELRTGSQVKLLSLADIVVSGRYVRALRTEALTWCGSSNQHVHFLTDRYDLSELHNPRLAESFIDRKGDLVVTGMPPAGLLKAHESA
jgi:anaerobic ribonucleoside-triphosphate reductase activating protein